MAKDLEARERDPGVRFADGEDLSEEYMLAPNPRATAISLKILDCFAASLGLCHMYSMMFGLDITISGR